MTAPLNDLLLTHRPLPQDPVQERIVLWRSFRTEQEARDYAQHVMLGAGQHLVGGTCEDSVGAMYWIGVQVDDIAKWGNTKAIQLSDPFDGENPDTLGRPFENK